MTSRGGDDRIAMRNVKRIRHTDEAAARLARFGRDGRLDFSVVLYRSKRHRHPKGRGGLELAVQQWGESSVRVKENSDARDPRGDLFEQLKPFSYDRRVVGGEPCNVAAGSCEALNQAQSDRIGHDYENNRYCVRLLLQRRDRRRGAGENCVRRSADQFCRISPEASRIARGKAVVDLDILTLYPPETP